MNNSCISGESILIANDVMAIITRKMDIILEHCSKGIF